MQIFKSSIRAMFVFSALFCACTTDFTVEDTDEDTLADTGVEVPGDAIEEDEGCGTTWYYDEDGDGYGVETRTFCAPDAPVGYTLHSGDCCDNDPDAFPGQTTYFDVPSLCGTFDYDCDGENSPALTMDMEYCTGDLHCSTYLDAATCEAEHGYRCFDRPVECGVEAHYIHCIFRPTNVCELVPDYYTPNPIACR